ncbi:MAG TPA: beta-galactosidase [Oculatellaceae cyanobacterium]
MPKRKTLLIPVTGSISVPIARTLVMGLILTGTATPVQAGSSDWAKYFNPIPQKSYVNKSQDREIKKKAFKTDKAIDNKPIPNKEVGLFAVLSSADIADSNSVESVLKDSQVNGISVLIPWRLLEPSEEQYDWKALDDILGLCKQANKYLILRVSTCGLSKGDADSDTPDWVYKAGVKYIEYKDQDGKLRKMPIFWDTQYLAKWSNFIQALGERYDKNSALHSVGITGGGILGSTLVVPDMLKDKENYSKLEDELTHQHGMSQRQLVTHWKYVADLFPKAFPTARLNFDIDPPTPNRAGQDTLDEISDYLVFRYGQRIFLTRQNVRDAKHGFDEYRVILKFKADTFTGYELASGFDQEDWEKMAKNALDDGVSFVEVPKEYLAEDNKAAAEALSKLQEHLGYQLVLKSADIDRSLKAGEPLKASLSFLNAGSSTPKAASRQLDKDVSASYQVGFEIKDTNGKPIVVSVQTPPIPTNQWIAGKPVTWEEKYRLTALKPGEYTINLCVIDKQSKRRLQILDGTKDGADVPQAEVSLGKLTVSE